MMISIKYASHLPVLTRLLPTTTGPVLELGIGLYSTPYLHWICSASRRQLTSYDSDPKWIRYFRDAKSDIHEVALIDDWDKMPIDMFWDIAFIDHAPDHRRSIEAKRLANNAKYLILHDTEPEVDSLYGYSQIYPLFKYRYDYTLAKPYTTILSNFTKYG